MFIGVGFFLLCCLAACSPLKKMVNWIPFRGNEKPHYGLTDKEIEKFRHTIKIVNSDPESHYRLACFYQEKKKHPLAIEEFKKALQNDPEYAKAYNGLGVSYDFLSEFPSAIKAYEAALRLNPNLAYVYNNLGYSYLLQKKLDLAIKAFQQAIALDKENKQYHNNLGLAYGKQGKFDLAFNEFKCAGNEEKARRYMVQLFHQEPDIHSAQALVAENLPPDNTQENGQENLSQTARIDHSVREENLEASASGNLPPKDYKQFDESKDAVLLKKKPAEVKAMGKNIKDARIKEGGKPTRYAGRSSTKKIEVTSQSFSPADNAQSLFNNLKKSPHNRQRFPVSVEIEISNGNGVSHFARRVGYYLAKKGFKVTSLKNEPRFNKLKTKIYYCEDYRQDACSVAKQLPGSKDVVKVSGFKKQNIKVRLVLGKDMVSYYKNLFSNKNSLRSL